jgi:Ran GTPase-activating protein (RanGAP) involved in mRNA processing and transport
MLQENDVIMDLNLSHNKLGYAAGASIAESLTKNRAVKVLDISYNKIASAGIVSMPFFYKFLCMNCTLRTLNLEGNRLGYDWGMMISEALCRNSTLIQVGLNNTSMTVETGNALVNVYSHNNTLLEIGMTRDEIGHFCFEKLREVFVRKRALKSVIDDMKGETRISPSRHTHHKLKVYDHHSR